MQPSYGKRSISLLIPLILVSIFMVAFMGFAGWAFMGRQDYKNNVDKKISDASVIVKQQTSTEKDKEFVEKEKNPLKRYRGPETYGSVDFQYPKTWSAFIDESGTSGVPINGYLHPDFVPGLQSKTAYALRFQVVNQSYFTDLKTFESRVKSGKVQISPFQAAKVPGVIGSRIDGEITLGQKDSKVLLPIRDKTLEIWTESDQYVKDFNNIILPNLIFQK